MLLTGSITIENYRVKTERQDIWFVTFKNKPLILDFNKGMKKMPE